MKNLFMAFALMIVSSVALAQHRPGPRPMPGPNHGGYHPVPGPHYPGPGPYHPAPGPHYPVPGPHYPVPMPHPYPTGYACRVALVDRYGRAVRLFYGSTDYNGLCRNALNDCNWEQRRMGAWDLRCVQAR